MARYTHTATAYASASSPAGKPLLSKESSTHAGKITAIITPAAYTSTTASFGAGSYYRTASGRVCIPDTERSRVIWSNTYTTWLWQNKSSTYRVSGSAHSNKPYLSSASGHLIVGSILSTGLSSKLSNSAEGMSSNSVYLYGSGHGGSSQSQSGTGNI